MNLGAYLRYALFAPFRGNPATRRLSSVFDLPTDALAQSGITLLVFDVDDTLTGFRDSLSERSLAFIADLGRHFSIAILSNAGPVRGEEVRRTFSGLASAIVIGDKPSAAPFVQILAETNHRPEQAAMIGDRAGMDLAGAREAGFRERILVRPYSEVFGGNMPKKGYRFIRALEALGAPASPSR